MCIIITATLPILSSITTAISNLLSISDDLLAPAGCCILVYLTLDTYLVEINDELKTLPRRLTDKAYNATVYGRRILICHTQLVQHKSSECSCCLCVPHDKEVCVVSNASLLEEREMSCPRFSIKLLTLPGQYIRLLNRCHAFSRDSRPKEIK
jgi:hypothetical protein